MQAKVIKLAGVVQGVGFRPFVYHLAEKHKVYGWVINNAQGVFIHAEGLEKNIQAMTQELHTHLPRGAFISNSSIENTEIVGYRDFTIRKSESSGSQDVFISPDLGLCSDCLKEWQEPDQRRYHYPFINCTHCGPRFSIIRSVPYDRPNTTMEDFNMCKECQQEYDLPENRRFHAQPNACPHCGPQLKMFNKEREEVRVEPGKLLSTGNILAVKGLGGYHLVCDALNPQVITKLRIKKRREAKPFAVMAKNMDIVKKYCHVHEKEEKLLKSYKAPIVIMAQRNKNLPEELAPKMKTLGVMLPYTPLHLLLFTHGMELLVMTSANYSGHPLVYQDAKVFSELENFVDYFLTHNREIVNRCDDSVCKIIAKQERIFRRARGYVPLPIPIQEQKAVLACGSDQKNTFCLTKKNWAFLSQYNGNLNNYPTYSEFVQTTARFKEYFGIEPELIVVDAHPQFVSREWGSQREKPVLEVQHHHAHLASCMAEHGIDDPILGVICDGTGYGEDGNIWGMEFLLGDYSSFQRLAHLEYVPMPGGEKAIKEPIRMAISYLYQYLGRKEVLKIPQLWQKIQSNQLNLLLLQIDRGINCPQTSSCGRLFDAVSALLGVCTRVSYQGQAAIELEQLAKVGLASIGYSFTIERGSFPWVISTANLWREIMTELGNQISPALIATRFHLTVAEMIRNTCVQLKAQLPTNKVILSGGVMQNKFLVEKTVKLLEEAGFIPLLHSQIPANDGGISLGQAVIGGRWLHVHSNSS